jgi:hypothetical protein
MSAQLWVTFAWLAGASLLGFMISTVFSGWLKLSRRIFLIPYVSIISLFLVFYASQTKLNLVELFQNNWVWGLLASAVVGILLILSVRYQPASTRSSGAQLAVDVAWLGLTYGLIDGLFLNVLPVFAIWEGFSNFDWVDTWWGGLGVGIFALLASLLVTAAYHLGYSEYRNLTLGRVLIGNALITSATLVSLSPWGSIVSHMIMHVAAVFRGPETMLQLPPHQRQSSRMRTAE